MIPFYIYYSMFGFQRVGDLAWAAGDMRARGFLLGATAGRTTLNGEGLQHEDGHSHILSVHHSELHLLRSRPSRYEVAVIVQDGLRRMYAEQEDVFYYITLMNENYEHPAMPEGAQDGHPEGHVPAARRRAQRRAARAVAGQRHDPARGDRGRRSAGRRLRRLRRHLELPELHRAAPRRRWRRALEHAASGGDAAQEPCRAVPRRARRAGDRLDRLHEGVRRPDPALRARPLPRAGHGRVRPFRLPAEAALVLRGGPPLRGGRGAARRWPTKARSRHPSSPTRSASIGIDPEKPAAQRAGRKPIAE